MHEKSCIMNGTERNWIQNCLLKVALLNYCCVLINLKLEMMIVKYEIENKLIRLRQTHSLSLSQGLN